MKRWILIAFLSVVVAGSAFWGYQEHQEKNAILVQAENNYQRAFHDLAYHIDLIHDEIGTALAMNSDERLSPQMVEIWRLTSEASTDVGQLPLTLMPFNKTEEFLSDIGDFTYRTAVRNLDDTPLTDEETDKLHQLYKQAGEIETELRRVQHLALENNLRWMDVQMALINNESNDNTVIDGLKTVEKTVKGFSEAQIESSITGVSNVNHQFDYLKGSKEISEKEALKISKDIFNVKDDTSIRITETGEGAEVPMYTANYVNGEKRAYMDITKQGGQPISFLVDRPIHDTKISLNEGMERATEYIEKLGYEDMILFQSSQYDNMGAYSFLYNQDGVKVYPDAIEVKVALDDGEILGLTAKNFMQNHKERDISKPKIKVSEAKDMVNPKVDIQEEFLAIIDNDLGEEVLTHEFLGIYGDDTYRIFINAMDGREEKVEKLGGSEINYAVH